MDFTPPTQAWEVGSEQEILVAQVKQLDYGPGGLQLDTFKSVLQFSAAATPNGTKVLQTRPDKSTVEMPDT